MSKTQKYMNLTEQEKKELDKQTGREIAGFGLIITIVSLIFGIIYLIVGAAMGNDSWAWKQATTWSAVWKAFVSGGVIAIAGALMNKLS